MWGGGGGGGGLLASCVLMREQRTAILTLNSVQCTGCNNYQRIHRHMFPYKSLSYKI